MPRVAAGRDVGDRRERAQAPGALARALRGSTTLGERRAWPEHVPGQWGGARRRKGLESGGSDQPLERRPVEEHEVARGIETQPVTTEAPETERLQIRRCDPQEASGA